MIRMSSPYSDDFEVARLVVRTGCQQRESPTAFRRAIRRSELHRWNIVFAKRMTTVGIALLSAAVIMQQSTQKGGEIRMPDAAAEPFRAAA